MPAAMSTRQTSSRPLRVLFLNENLGGHATMHRAIRSTIGAHPQILATFVDLPPRGLFRRIAGAGIPILDRLDLDFAALRSQLAVSLIARRILRGLAGSYDVLHVYTQHAVLLSAETLASTPTIVSTDATGEQVSRLLPYRLPTRWTPVQNRLRAPLEQRVYDSATLVIGKSQWCVDSLRNDTVGPSGDHVRRHDVGAEGGRSAVARVPGTTCGPRRPQRGDTRRCARSAGRQRVPGFHAR
jgi:hypothetical protein